MFRAIAPVDLAPLGLGPLTGAGNSRCGSPDQAGQRPQTRCEEARPAIVPRAHTVGRMFWFIRKRLPGSYRFLRSRDPLSRSLSPLREYSAESGVVSYGVIVADWTLSPPATVPLDGGSSVAAAIHTPVIERFRHTSIPAYSAPLRPRRIYLGVVRSPRAYGTMDFTMDLG